MNTLLLSPDWDLTIDGQKNIAVSSDGLAPAQDAASEIRLFLGELYYDTQRGVPYFQQILGKYPPLNYVRAKFEAAAKLVPTVVSAKCYFTSFVNRKLGGQVQVTTSGGQTTAASF
jgi:hypothetical protein